MTKHKATETMQRHAYLILAHNEPEILTHLLQLLDDERNDIFLHIDRKSHELHQHFSQFKLQHAGFYLIRKPIGVYWGHSSQIEAEILCLRAAHSQGHYSHYHLLSGVDLPVKTQDEIHRYFEAHPDTEYVGFWQNEEQQKDAIKKTRYYYLFNRYKKRSTSRVMHGLTTPLRNVALLLQKGTRLQRTLRLGTTILQPSDIKKGDQWFSITDEACRYILNHDVELLEAFNHTLCPDEIFLQTMLWNSPLRERIAPEGALRAIDWERGQPYVWQEEDVEQLLKGNNLFARKFSSEHFQAVEKIAESLQKPMKTPEK